MLRPTLLPLRLALAVAVRTARPSPLRDAVAHAARLRVGPAEAEAERAVDRLRQRLAATEAAVEVVDYGAGTHGGARPPARRVGDVYRRAAARPTWGRFLFGLARALQPRRVLELGTNLGVSAAHLAAALRRTEAEGGPAGRLITLEGAPALADLARQHLAGLGHGVGPEGRVEVVVGRFDETLAAVCEREGPFDLVFVDGHHEAAAALRYIDAIRPHLAPGAVVVLDDVEPLRPVRRAWRALRRSDPAAPAVDLGKLGLIALGPVPSGPSGQNEGRLGAVSALARETPSAPPTA